MLKTAHTFTMSQWNHLPSGSKRRSDFSEPERPRSYQFAPSQHSHESTSSDVSTSPHSSQEGQTPKIGGRFPSHPARIGISSDTRADASFHASSSKMRLPIPLPTSSTTFALPPIGPSSQEPASHPPHSAIFSKSIGTEYSTVQTLQRENTDLASAYAQAQTYIADLDARLQASRAENGKLVKERHRLTGKIELLEIQLEEQEQSIQQTQQHTAAKDAQYARIMELSTRLQKQGLEDSQSLNAEQHEWSSEKRSLQSTIDSLKYEVETLRKAYPSNSRSINLKLSPIDSYLSGVAGTPDLAAKPSSHGLVTEVEEFKSANAIMEDALAGFRGDNAQLAAYIEKLSNVEKRFHRHLETMESARRRFDVLDRGVGTPEE